MEVGGPEDSLSTTQLGPLTSTPRESAPPLPPTDLPSQTDSSTSISSESSGEDWLIKICCPGARHRYCRHAKKKKQISQHQKTGFLQSLDKEDSITKSAEGMPITSYQTPTGVLRQESSDLQWLIRLRCPRTQMEQIPHLKQCLPAASSSLSRSPSKTCQSSPSERAKTSESWLTPKHFSVVQAIVNESQDICSTLSLLERENCFVRGNAFLESYTPSVYDPFFLKTCTDIWKASIPPLNDPLLKEIQERYFEAGIIKQCDTGKIYSSKEINELQKVELPLLPLSRQLMNPVEWLKIPPGYMESEIRQKSRQKMVPTRNMSSMDFKSWNDSSLLQPNKRCTSARKQDFVCLPSFLKKTRTGSSVCKPAIKFAS
ncbi:uncharacterized protein LOC110080662 isoform X5 [Pogona vitticeps]